MSTPAKSQPPAKKSAELNRGQPAALRRINIDAIVRKIQISAPITRSRLAQSTKLSYPTITKISKLLFEGRIIEWDPNDDKEATGRGRPSSSLRMASSNTQVISISYRPTLISAATTALDGRILSKTSLPIPANYTAILKTTAQLIKKLQQDNHSQTLGIGLSVPGQLDTKTNGLIIESPNISTMAGHCITSDINKMTNLPTVSISSMRALYNAENIRGQASVYENFVILSYYSGMSLATACNGTYVEGSNGMAGELGHLVIQPSGELCGCGNRGCLETLATDKALCTAISHSLGHNITVEEMLELIRKSPSRFASEIDQMLNYLAIAIGAAINIFNPQAIFLYGRLLEVNPTFLTQLKKKIPNRCLKNLADQCLVEKSKATMLQGAALAVVGQLTNKLTTQSE